MPGQYPDRPEGPTRTFAEDTDATEAMARANAAHDLASTANTSANTAKADANTAKSDASTARSAAASANGVAQSADTKATQAKTAADQAVSNAAVADLIARAAFDSAAILPLQPNGAVTFDFTQQYDAKPLLRYMVYNAAAGGMPIIVEAVSWKMSGNKYVGVNLQAYRAQKMGAMQPLSVATLLAGLITGVNSLITLVSGFNPFGNSDFTGAEVHVTARIRQLP